MPFSPIKGSSTLIAMSALFLKTPLFKEVTRMPDEHDGRKFREWLTSFKNFLRIYIEGSLFKSNLRSIADISYTLELIDVMKATLKTAEAKELEAPIKELQTAYEAIKVAREKIIEQNTRRNQSFQQKGGEVMKIVSIQPEMSRSMAPTVEEESKALKASSLEAARIGAKEDTLREDAAHMKQRLTKRISQEKARQLEEQVLAREIRPSSSAAGGG